MGHTRANCPEAHAPPAPAEDNMTNPAVEENDHVDGAANESDAPAAPANYASVVRNASQVPEDNYQVADTNLPTPRPTSYPIRIGPL